MVDWYAQHQTAVMVAGNAIAFFMFLFFCIFSRGLAWRGYYWRGFLMIWLSLSLTSTTDVLSPAFKVLLKGVMLSMSFYGFYLVVKGEKVRRRERGQPSRRT